jgi:hypothetical protein
LTEEVAYFCCLEGLRDATKHAAATTITVHLDLADGETSLTVTNDVRTPIRGFGQPCSTSQNATRNPQVTIRATRRRSGGLVVVE